MSGNGREEETMQDVQSGSDLIDVRDLIERFEELESNEERDPEECEEYALIEDFLADIKGKGGDHDWRGAWYPVTLIRDSYFETYARELADDIGAIKDDAAWPCTCIDWEEAARQLQQDYTSAEYDGVTYWMR